MLKCRFFNTTLSKPVLKLANLVDSLLGLWISKHILSGQCRFRPDSGEREFRSVLGPTGNKLQRKLPEMKLKKKKKKHMKSKYEKTKNLDVSFVAYVPICKINQEGGHEHLPDFSVVSNVFKKKQDSEQSTAELALEKDDDDDITVEQAWDDIVQRVKFLSADHPLGSHLRATQQLL
ncbi:hypothetical protein F2Q68_00029829 [Brassica cretica]|uniref:Uncharacterized protein n=1 Tax=Brassica cretica TaxID=69181 RepID=A0A8S9GBW3_BRACR|nr:hypothetical protein F2Q68_00029829 [Brassica cretica]